MPHLPLSPPLRARRPLVALGFASFLTLAACESTTPPSESAGAAGVGGSAGAAAGAAGSPGSGGPVTDPGTGGFRAGMQANGSIAYVRNK
jgi:hypothetical protein